MGPGRASGSTVLGNSGFHGSTACGVLPGERSHLVGSFLWTVDVSQGERKPLIGTFRINKRFCFQCKKSSGQTQWVFKERSPCFIISGTAECHTPWACKRAGACGRGLYRWLWYWLQQSRTEKQPLPAVSFHITLYTHVRKKPSKTHKPNSGKGAPPQINQTKRKTKQNFLFLYF